MIDVVLPPLGEGSSRVMKDLFYLNEERREIGTSLGRVDIVVYTRPHIIPAPSIGVYI